MYGPSRRSILLPLLTSTALLIVATPLAARADPSQARAVRGLIRMGFDFGGDKIASVRWTNGDTADIKAGGLITFAGGALYHPPDAHYAVEATLGYKFDRVNGTNGHIIFMHFPLDLIASATYGGHRLGAGPTVHFGTNYGCHADGLCDSDTGYGTDVGLVVQYAYDLSLGGNTGLEGGLRFTYINYSADHLPTLSGTCGGFFFGVLL